MVSFDRHWWEKFPVCAAKYSHKQSRISDLSYFTKAHRSANNTWAVWPWEARNPAFDVLSMFQILTPPPQIYSLDFTICNPPFYSSSSDLVASASAKSHSPYSACTGAAVEMVTPGGEVAFVTRMIKESLVLKRKCQWYTSMLGKLSSVQSLLQLLLQECQVKNWAVKEFIHGSKTRRWAIAWTFHKARPNKVCNQTFF